MKQLTSCLFIILVFASEALGWGKEGHIIVAKIAEYGLTDKSKAELHKLGFDHIGTDEVANYADKVRRNKDYPQYFKSGPWHFVDLPIGKFSDSKISVVKDFIAEHKPNVVTQIKYYIDVLKDRKSTIADKREAVKFIVHFIGDVHQPLHCADRNDHGGNGLKVHYLGKGGKYLNLHHVWDTNLVKELIGNDSIETLAKKLFVNKNVNIDIDSWAYESYIIASNCAYRINGTPDSNLLPKDGTPNLNEEYVKQSKEAVKLRLQQAGTRLSTVLNNIFNSEGM